jgi:hypothetical protein
MRSLLFIFLLISCQTAFCQYDSLVVYHRSFCSDYGKLNGDLNRIKDFGVVTKYISEDTSHINQIISELRTFKPAKRKYSKLYQTYVLGAYVYNNGKEKLLFAVSPFQCLFYKNEILAYKEDFLDLLFKQKPLCYW